MGFLLCNLLGFVGLAVGLMLGWPSIVLLCYNFFFLQILVEIFVWAFLFLFFILFYNLRVFLFFFFFEGVPIFFFFLG